MEPIKQVPCYHILVALDLPLSRKVITSCFPSCLLRKSRFTSSCASYSYRLANLQRLYALFLVPAARRALKSCLQILISPFHRCSSRMRLASHRNSRYSSFPSLDGYLSMKRIFCDAQAPRFCSAIDTWVLGSHDFG